MGVQVNIDNRLVSRSGVEGVPKSRGIPKLGGSGAGFIVLIATLCLVILISLTAIFFLLRDNPSPDEERQRKTHRPRTTTYVTPLEDGESPQGSWLRRAYQRLTFAHTTSSDHIPQIKVGQHREGLYAAPRDEWATDSLDDLHLNPPARRISRHFPADKLRTSITSIPASQSTRRPSNPNSNSTCSVRFDLDSPRATLPTEKERYAPSPTVAFSNAYTQMLSSPTSSPPSSPSTAHRHSSVPSQDRPISSLPSPSRHEQNFAHHPTVGSPVPTLATFEGGTKFIEAL